MTFDSDGGSEVEAQTVASGETATEPDDPAKDGAVFDGWYAEGADEAFDFSTAITENITLTAQWLTTVAKPEASEDLTYTGSEITAVAAADGYTVEGGSATHAGTYTATVTLAEGYAWEDGTTDAITIEYTIAADVEADTSKVGAGATVDAEQIEAAAEAIAESIEGVDSLELVLIVESGADSTADQALIEEKLAEGQQAVYFNTELLLSYTSADGTVVENLDYGDENTQLLKLVYPFTFTNRTDVHVYRVHNGALVELTTSANADGEYVTFDTKAGTITVYAKKYSTFGVGYTQEKTIPSTADGAMTGVAVAGGVGFAAFVVVILAAVFARRRER